MWWTENPTHPGGNGGWMVTKVRRGEKEEDGGARWRCVVVWRRRWWQWRRGDDAVRCGGLKVGQSNVSLMMGRSACSGRNEVFGRRVV
ncbi:hypothetical protein Tco_0112039 [Tanacetum coccineum]|uniref:Uncharacterized protein n=1 Tax=Tanacetum coccineum TaxID=301880 RepID=A0ABQ5IGS8_9ASTR